MEIYIFSREMELLGIIDRITSLIWTRKYWECGKFKLLVPFTEHHIKKLKKGNLIMMRGGNEAAEIKYVHITKNSQGIEQIEVQGAFLLSWIGKRVLTNQIICRDTTANILKEIVKKTCVEAGATRNIPRLQIASVNVQDEEIEYVSEKYTNALLALETAAKAAKLGVKIVTNARNGKHEFVIYKGRLLTVGNNEGNTPCIFSQEYDNVVEQEYTNSVENLKTTAYVGGEEKEGMAQKIAQVGNEISGLDRDEVYINASDIQQEYKNENGQEIVLSDSDYMNLLLGRGSSELEQFAETLEFSSKINANANLQYGTDYDLGDIVTCVNKNWGIRIDVRITEITETYEGKGRQISISFGEGLPALMTQIRQASR